MEMGFMTRLFSNEQAVERFEQSLLQTLSEFGQTKGSNLLLSSKGPTSQNKKLCSYCRESYDLNHDCPLRPKGKAHRIMWVPYEDSEPKKTDQQSNHEKIEQDAIKMRESYEREAPRLFEDYQSLPDEIKAQYSLNNFLKFVVIMSPEKIGLVKFIRRMYKEKISSKGTKFSHGHNVSRNSRTSKSNYEKGSISKLNDQVTGTPIMSKNEMRRQGLCFTCKGFREPNHQCTDNEVKKIKEGLVLTHEYIEEEAMKEVDLEMHLLHEDEILVESPKYTTDNSLVGKESQDNVWDGHAVIVGDKVYEDMASTTSSETSYEVQSSSTLDVDGCTDDNTHDAIDYEGSDVDSASCYSSDLDGEKEVVQEMELEMYGSDQFGGVVQFVNNPLFKANATMAYDNPLFEIDVDRTLDPSPELSSDRDVWSPASVLGCQTQLMEEFVDVYMVRSAYSFAFDPNVHDLLQVHSSDDVEVDRVQHDDPASVQGVVSTHDGDFGFGRSSTLFSHNDYHLIHNLETCCVLEIGGIRVAQREAIGSGFPIVWLHQIRYHSFGNELIQQIVRVLVLQKLFGDDRDIMQFFLWDPGGELLEDKQFQEGRTVMSPSSWQ